MRHETGRDFKYVTTWPLSNDSACNRVVQGVECSHEGCSERCGAAKNGKFKPPEAIYRYASNAGWKVDTKRGRHLCPEHQRTKPMNTKTKIEEPTISPATRRSIFRAIDEGYDDKKMRYIEGVDDKTIAAEIGTTWGWVKRIREENFGPAGPDPEFEKLSKEISAMQITVAGIETEMLELATKAENYGKALVKLKSRLDALL